MPTGAVIMPPVTTQLSLQVLLTIPTLDGVGNVGQAGQIPGTVVTEPEGLDTAVFASQLQRVRIVCAGPSWS